MRFLLHRNALTATAMLAAVASSAYAQFSDITDLADRLEAFPHFNAAVRYSVLLPTASEDIVYDIDMQSMRVANDTLCPCDYLIEWRTATTSTPSEGFSAYTNGSHFRYRDERLQEYHVDWDAAPFLSGGGVQCNAQFADLLPYFLADKLRTIANDPTYSYTFTPDALRGGKHVAVVEATQEIRGYVGSQATYVFDASTGLPYSVEIEYNPGAISEQTVEATYLPPTTQMLSRFSEDALIERHPEVFERFRSSTFRAENLPGTALPAFSAPTLTGERYSRLRGEHFAMPMVVVFVDPEVASTPEVIKQVRDTLSLMPFNVGVIWAFNSSHIDDVEALVGAAEPYEYTLLSARSLARDCGVTAWPTLLFVRQNGTINGVQIGNNNSLPEIVMQETVKLDH